MDPPSLLSSTSTTLTLNWEAPGSDGGCPITSFGLLRDDGAGGSITVPVDAASINGKPGLSEYTATLTSFKGTIVRFRLQATNEIGTTTSTGYLAALVAGPPGTLSVVQPLSAQISASQIAFVIPEITDDGGSSIETYQVLMDDGAGGDFKTISGYPVDSLKTDFLITSGIQMGNTYRVMYR